MLGGLELPRLATRAGAPEREDARLHPPADATPAKEQRLSALGAAMLRISASLDLDTVLREVVESARTLTGARCGCIATIDDTGAPQDFFLSGFTEGEHRRSTPRRTGFVPALGVGLLREVRHARSPRLRLRMLSPGLKVPINAPICPRCGDH